MDFKSLRSKDCRIIVDTCSMMSPRFEEALEKMIPLLDRSGNKLIVPNSCVKELRKHSKTTELSAKAIDAANALNILRKNKAYISIKGDETDPSHADNVILRVCNQFKIRYYLIVITEDKALRMDICNINNQKSVRGNKIEVVNVDYIANYKIRIDHTRPFSIQSEVTNAPDKKIEIKHIPEKNSNVFTEDGTKICLADEISSGGEGTVYKTDTEYVAKIYRKDKLSERKKKKIDLLVQSGVNVKGVCFPEKCLYYDEEKKEFVGYLMKKAEGKSLDCSFFKGERGVNCHFSKWSRSDLVELCITILSTINKLHSLGIIIGDLNGANILVTSPTSVFFVDTDSFQINDLPCPVGKEEFTAPEIQGKDYGMFLRTEGNENFAVATLLFRLLMFGIDPYTQKDGESISHNIQSGDFSFPFRDNSNGKTPEGDWKFFWSHLFFPIKEQFYSTFKKGGRFYSEEDRPNVADWLKLLKRYKTQLKDGTISEYDENSTLMFPKSYKKNPKEKYLKCQICNQEVVSYNIKTANGENYCWDCLHKYEIIECKSCGAQMEYSNYRRYIDKIPEPNYCKACKEKYKDSKKKYYEEKKAEERRRREEAYIEREIYRSNVYRSITCSCCGNKFNITNGEKDYFEGKGFDLPKRCPKCRSQGRRPDYSRKDSTPHNSSGSSGCFITTAVCDFYGKADDCYELMTLRGFRDDWLAMQPDGKALVKEYYLNAPGLVERMKKSDSFEHYCMVLMNEYINPCVSLINQGRNEECKRMYIDGINYLMKELN